MRYHEVNIWDGQIMFIYVCVHVSSYFWRRSVSLNSIGVKLERFQDIPHVRIRTSLPSRRSLLALPLALQLRFCDGQ